MIVPCLICGGLIDCTRSDPQLCERCYYDAAATCEDCRTDPISEDERPFCARCGPRRRSLESLYLAAKRSMA